MPSFTVFIMLGKFPILLASDIASRGIHVPNVHYVVNYDFPGSLDQVSYCPVITSIYIFGSASTHFLFFVLGSSKYVHRCGRAGRNQLFNSEATSGTPPTVFSFFTREFSPMADSVIELLRICNAHVDPNLLVLSSSAKKAVAGANTAKNGCRDKEQKKRDTSECMSRVDNDNKSDQRVDSDEEQFSYLDSKRIVLKRASNVSDHEDSDDEDS